MKKLNWNLLSRHRGAIYGLSILWIFFYHVRNSFPKPAFFKRIPFYIFKSGNIGVDVFLFLSGISLYYAMRKNDDLKVFYRRRFTKILKIYIFFCIPYFVLFYATGNLELGMFLKQVTFSKKDVNTFWFLLCIMICYAIYPLLYRLICAGRQKWIVIGLGCYVAALLVWGTIDPQTYQYDEIMLGRIPVFIAGSLAGKNVYDGKKVPPMLLFVTLLSLLGKDVMFYLCYAIPFLGRNRPLIGRLFSGVQGVGSAFFMAILLQYFEGMAGYRMLQKLGTITLEFYVTHLAFREISIEILKVTVAGRWEKALYTATLLALSAGASVLLNRLLYQTPKKELPQGAKTYTR